MWDAPSKQLQRGCQAWQEWNYELLVTTHFDVAVSETNPEDKITIANITETSYLFHRELTSFTEKIESFSFRVRAKSSSGTVCTYRDCNAISN